MLTHPMSERLRALGLVAMAQALEEQRRQPDLDGLGFEERLALLVEREASPAQTLRCPSPWKGLSWRTRRIATTRSASGIGPIGPGRRGEARRAGVRCR
jgi:hypothetical protein